MRSPPCSPRSGFTLVELMVGATLSALVMAAVLSSYIYLARGLARLANQQGLESAARRTLGYFAQDVEAATGISGIPSASKLALFVPATSGTNVITYYYNGGTSDVTPTISGTTVTVPAQSLVRCVYDGTTVTSLVLLTNITDNDGGTNADLAFRYYDAAGSAYDSGLDPYTTSTSYLIGIKQVSLQFSTQTGSAASNTQTLVHKVASSRLALRSRDFLP